MTDTTTFTPIADLREGDRLRLVGSGWQAQDRIGRFVIVERIDLEAGRAWVHPAPDDESENGYFHAVYVNDDRYAAVRVENEEGTFDRYDPRMLPMFRTVSRIADNAGYCQEYDRIAQAIGAPTREEIRAMSEREFIVRIPVTGYTEYRIQARSEAEARSKAYRDVPVLELLANPTVEADLYETWTAREA